jgi:ribonuclease HI
MQKRFFLYTDGASRSNPGLSGIGFVLYDCQMKIVQEGSFFIGIATNNMAEYLALVAAFFLCFDIIKDHKVQVYADSLLLINQLKGIWKVKDQKLRKCFLAIKKFRDDIEIEPIHVYREKNVYADMLANKGIDEHNILPYTLAEFIQRNCQL